MTTTVVDCSEDVVVAHRNTMVQLVKAQFVFGFSSYVSSVRQVQFVISSCRFQFVGQFGSCDSVYAVRGSSWIGQFVFSSCSVRVQFVPS